MHVAVLPLHVADTVYVLGGLRGGLNAIGEVLVVKGKVLIILGSQIKPD